MLGIKSTNNAIPNKKNYKMKKKNRKKLALKVKESLKKKDNKQRKLRKDTSYHVDPKLKKRA